MMTKTKTWIRTQGERRREENKRASIGRRTTKIKMIRHTKTERTRRKLIGRKEISGAKLIKKKRAEEEEKRR